MKLRLTSFDDMETIIEESFKSSGDGIGGFDVDELSSQLIDRMDSFFNGGNDEK